MLQWFQRIMPQQRMFFPLFEKHAELIEQAALALQAMLNDGADMERQCRAIGELESQADDVTREVLLGVRSSFITPIDRIDIRHLVSSMDDTIDRMNKSAQAIMSFELKDFTPEMRELTALSVDASRLVRRAVPLLSAIAANADRISAMCIQISRLEERGDQLYARGRKQLFNATRADGAMEFIRQSEVYAHLDQVVDNFDNVGNEIQGIVVEHA
jgi:predicted phosphate transport protein (TIGR00153 family)